MQKPRVLPTKRRSVGEFVKKRRPQCAHRTGSIPLVNGMDAARFYSARATNTRTLVAHKTSSVATSCKPLPFNNFSDMFIININPHSQFIADHVESQCNALGCQQLVMEALKWHLLPERRSQVSSKRTRPRKSTMGKLLAVGGLDAHKGAISIESYCPRLDRWAVLKNMTGRRLQFGVAVIEDKLIIVGGRDGLKTLNSVRIYHTSIVINCAKPTKSITSIQNDVCFMHDGSLPIDLICF